MSSVTDDEYEEEYEVEKIISHRNKGAKREYLVKWVGYDDTNNTWEPLKNLEAASKERTPRKATKTQAKDGGISTAISLSDSDIDDDINSSPVSAPRKRTLRNRKIPIGDDHDSDSGSDWGQLTKTKRPKIFDSGSDSNDDINGDIDNDSVGANEGEVDDESNIEDSDMEGDVESISEKSDKKKGNGKNAATSDHWARRHLEVKVGDKRETLYAIVDFDYPTGDVDWEREIKQVTGIFCDRRSNEKRAILEWKNGDYSLQDTKKLHRKCPLLLLEYYEGHMTFMEDIKVTEK
ncbi:unnamed protein product [Absidia cylindrospora]